MPTRGFNLLTFTLGLTAACVSSYTAWCREPRYIDAAVCVECHAKAAEGYFRSGMARSFGLVRPGTLAAQTLPGQFHHRLTDQDYAVSRRNSKLYLRRSIAGFDGKPADVFEAEMGYWIGSGNHARSYLSRGSQGK